MNASIASALAADQELVRRGTLNSKNAAYYSAATASPSRGIVLALHGFSAGTWQFGEIAQVFNRNGLDVYAARLPGHGHLSVTGKASPELLPKMGHQNLYVQFGEEVFAQALAAAKEKQVPLYLLGFSAGAAISVDIQARHAADISRMVIIAPFIRPANRAANRLLTTLRLLAAEKLAASLLNRLPFSWPEAERARIEAWQRAGHWDFKVGNVFALMQFAWRATQLSVRVPTLAIVSQADALIDLQAVQDFVHKNSANVQIWEIDKTEAVPHAALTQNENANQAMRTALFTKCAQFLVRE